ncbi:unnamed protein product, partial [Musa textilis]
GDAHTRAASFRLGDFLRRPNGSPPQHVSAAKLPPSTHSLTRIDAIEKKKRSRSPFIAPSSAFSAPRYIPCDLSSFLLPRPAVGAESGSASSRPIRLRRPH